MNNWLASGIDPELPEISATTEVVRWQILGHGGTDHLEPRVYALNWILDVRSSPTYVLHFQFS